MNKKVHTFMLHCTVHTLTYSYIFLPIWITLIHVICYVHLVSQVDALHGKIFVLLLVIMHKLFYQFFTSAIFASTSDLSVSFTLSNLDCSWGPHVQRKAKSAGFTFLLSSLLIRMKFNVVLKQFSLNSPILLQSEIFLIMANIYCSTDSIKKN